MPKGFNITVEGMDELKKKFGDRTNSILSDISEEIEGAAYNIQQRPERFNINKEPQYIQSGQVMDLWISQDKKVALDSANNKQNYIP